MTTYDEAEQAYKNGYKQGVKEFAHLLIDKRDKGVIYAMDIPDYVIEMIGAE